MIGSRIESNGAYMGFNSFEARQTWKHTTLSTIYYNWKGSIEDFEQRENRNKRENSISYFSELYGFVRYDSRLNGFVWRKKTTLNSLPFGWIFFPFHTSTVSQMRVYDDITCKKMETITFMWRAKCKTLTYYYYFFFIEETFKVKERWLYLESLKFSLQSTF